MSKPGKPADDPMAFSLTDRIGGVVMALLYCSIPVAMIFITLARFGMISSFAPVWWTVGGLAVVGFAYPDLVPHIVGGLWKFFASHLWFWG
jgi:hypothetical protein